ncbi:hypothetical protein C0995_008012, partial [Termitomyces sp. Mi166
MPGVAALAPSPSNSSSISSTPKPPTQQTPPHPTPMTSHPAAIPTTQALLMPFPAKSPMVTGPLTTAMPSLAAGSPMNTMSPMALSTPTPSMLETPIISYTFEHYSGGNIALHGSNTAQRSWSFR